MGFVFLATVSGYELVVFGLDVGVGWRIGFLEVGHHVVDQQVLAQQLNLRFEFVGGVEPALLAFLADDFKQHQAVFDLGRCVGWRGAAGAFHLPQHGLQAAGGYRFAVDDGDVLRHGADTAGSEQRGNRAAGEVRSHANSLKGWKRKRNAGEGLLDRPFRPGSQWQGRAGHAL